VRKGVAARFLTSCASFEVNEKFVDVLGTFFGFGLLLGDQGRQFGLGLRALDFREETAVKLGLQLVDLVGNRNHLSFCVEDGTGTPGRSGRIKDAAGAAQRGAGEPILSRVDDDRSARARSYARQNWGHRRHPLAGPIGTVR